MKYSINQPKSEKEIFESLNPIMQKWFKEKFGGFSDAQKHAVIPIRDRKNILVSSPTGSGKTLCAFTSILNYLINLSEKGELENKVYAVYVSPLKALSNDVEINLKQPLKEMEKIAGKKFGIKIAVRTGDTTASEKAKMLKECPNIIVTTPETLSILLTTIRFIDLMKAVEYVVIDEIHSLGNKRGVYLSISLERLEEISKITPVRIGLSATIAPLEEVANFLVGMDRECLIADVQTTKKTEIKVLTGVEDLIDTTKFDMHSGLYSLIDKLIQEHKTTVIFTNTRAATERVVNHLKEMFPSRYLEEIGAHHSSLSKEHRFNIEERLRKGELKCVVTSTSLELGIDIGYIDLVILLGSPKGSARALQRCLSYDSLVLCADGKYREIGEIVDKKSSLEIMSYDSKKGFIKNKIKKFHKNKTEGLLNIKLKCGEEFNVTGEHPILTEEGWKNAEDLKEKDLVAELRSKLKFNIKEPYFFELLPKDKIFVANKDNFFQKIVDEYRKKNKINCREFVKKFEMPYSRFTDCRRIRGRKKSVRLDYFLKACKLCEIPKSDYFPYLRNLKTKGKNWASWPLELTKELMWLAGIIATDGCIVRSKKKGEAEYYKIKLGNKSKMMIDKVREIVVKFGIKPYEVFKNNIHHIEFGSNLLAYFFGSLGIPSKRKTYELKIGELVFSLPHDLIYAYLEGIFEGDGNLNMKKNKKHGMIRIFTASEDFALGLHYIFSRLGHSNKISKTKIKKSKLIKKVSDRDLYCVSLLRKEDLRDFFVRIPGYGEKAKKGKLKTKDFLPYLSLKKNYNKYLEYSEVKEIKNLNNKSWVYNLTLEKEPNNFVVGNVVIHNCGRSGHKLHDVAKGRFIVLDRDDLIECSILNKECQERKIDKIHIPRNCLDVLSQQIYGMAIQKVWDIDEMFKVIRKSYCYSNLTREDFLGVISYLCGEYELEHRHVYAKIWYDKETKQIGKKGKMARVIYMTNIGTIPEESFVNVVIARGGEKNAKVGVIDEGFLEKIKPGDVFVLGGHKYQFLYTRGMNAYVNASVQRPPTIPSWFSEMLPLSFDSALEINKFRKELNNFFKRKAGKEKIIDFIKKYCYCEGKVSEAIYRYFYEQYHYAKIPHENRLLVEFYKGEKNYVVFHSLYGRRVNDALSRAIGLLMARKVGRDIEIGISDNGFYFAGENLPVEKVLGFLKPGNLKETLEEAILKTEVLKRRFRHCAARSLMILRNYKGRTKSVGRQQMSSFLLLSAINKISKDFPILKEARREVLEDLMDIKNAGKVLEWIKQGEVEIEYIHTKLPSPFALNLVLQGYSDLLKMEDKIEFLKRMHREVMREIGEKK
jgi:Lhr-like helicase